MDHIGGSTPGRDAGAAGETSRQGFLSRTRLHPRWMGRPRSGFFKASGLELLLPVVTSSSERSSFLWHNGNVHLCSCVVRGRTSSLAVLYLTSQIQGVSSLPSDPLSVHVSISLPASESPPRPSALTVELNMTCYPDLLNFAE